ncbi:MAG TPA: hypothetical protein VGM75_07720 [Pseudonocardiaceae bacterium]
MKWSYQVGLVVSVLTLLTGITSATASASPDDTSIVGSYYWNADGYTGTMNINSVASDGTVQATLYDYGQTENLTGTWNPAATPPLSITRPLPGGAVQTYSYYPGGSPVNSNPTMFGGEYNTSNSNGNNVGTYLDSAPPVDSVSHQAAATSSAAVNIVGSYFWNADGYTGRLNINSVASDGTVQATLYDNGQTENLTGTWYPSGDILNIDRPLPGNAIQYYWWSLGGLQNNSNPAMFGGAYSISDAVNPNAPWYGSYLDSAE